MGMKLDFEKIVKIVSRPYFEFVVGTQARLLYAFLTRIFLRLVVLEKEYMKRKNIEEKVFENMALGMHVPSSFMKTCVDFANFGHKTGDMHPYNQIFNHLVHQLFKIPLHILFFKTTN